MIQNSVVRYIILTIMFIMLTSCSQNDSKHQTRIEYIEEAYSEIKETHLLYIDDAWVDIINKRLQCFDSEYSVENRTKYCRRNYLKRILITARGKIKAAPLLGDFLVCLYMCPISHSMCKGNDENDDCVVREVQCIEYCLDNYWRGGRYANLQVR